MNSKLFGMLDVLGFSKFNETHELEDVIHYYAQLQENVSHFIALSALSSVKSFVISDTICVMPAKQPQMFSYNCFFLYLSMLLNHSCRNLYNGKLLPLRGAISFDEYVFDSQRKIFLGKAISVAYKWEQKQKWVGASICPDLVEGSMPDTLDFKPLTERKLLVNWDVPTSDGIVSTLAVNFVTQETSATILANLQTEYDRCEPAIKPKYYAAICFVRHICEKDLFVAHHEIADLQKWIEGAAKKRQKIWQH